jgi:hypothetical protein
VGMFEKFFEKFCFVAIIIILMTIAWAMWRPVLLDQNRLQEIVKVLNMHEQSIQNINQDINLLKQQIIKPGIEPKK